MRMEYDKIIIGAGMYGLYSAELCGRAGQKVLVLEYDAAPFMRATYINQARVHLGYHYPRSYSTAIKSRKYFDRFVEQYGFCINSDFRKIYATSARYSWTNAAQFRKFCRATEIKCLAVDPSQYFQPEMCDGVFETEEYTYDAALLRDHFLSEIARHPRVEMIFNARIKAITRQGDHYRIEMADGTVHMTGFLLNTSYGSVNQILDLLELEPIKIKYELCEIILCRVNEVLRKVGITVMDGPFFSIMPFGRTGLHSLTSVTFTPHIASHAPLPKFKCQEQCPSGYCSPRQLGNCNACPAKPESAWDYMSSLARKYLRDELRFEYDSSLFSIKPILMSSEIDDSRPTVIKLFSKDPTFISTLSGKINTVYDLDEALL